MAFNCRPSITNRVSRHIHIFEVRIWLFYAHRDSRLALLFWLFDSPPGVSSGGLPSRPLHFLTLFDQVWTYYQSARIFWSTHQSNSSIKVQIKTSSSFVCNYQGEDCAAIPVLLHRFKSKIALYSTTLLLLPQNSTLYNSFHRVHCMESKSQKSTLRSQSLK